MAVTEELNIIPANTLPNADQEDVNGGKVIIVNSYGDVKKADSLVMKGDKGDQGIQGIQGEKGETGAKGDKGAQGIQGERGVQGEKGERGIQGVKGDSGKSAYELWLQQPGNAGKPYSEYEAYNREPATSAKNEWNVLKPEITNKITEAGEAISNANTAASNADSKAGLANTAATNANTAASEANTAKEGVLDAIDNANDTAEHPTYIGTDFYVYKWNKTTKVYEKTDIFVKGSAGAGNVDIINSPTVKKDVPYVIVSTANAAQTYNAVEAAFGGKNLFSLPRDGNWHKMWLTPSSTIEVISDSAMFFIPVSKGGKYTINGDLGDTTLCRTCYVKGDVGIPQTAYNTDRNTLLPRTLEIDDDATYFIIQVARSIADEFKKSLMFQKGSIATDWSPAPEDKLNVTDVINNLTSTDTNKPLSAAQGKLLQDNKASTTQLNSAISSHYHRNLRMVDNRTVRPSDITEASLCGYFVSKTGLTSSTASTDYGDFLVLNGYPDKTGGGITGLYIPKSSKGGSNIEWYTGDFENSTTWGTPKILANMSDVDQKASTTQLDSAISDFNTRFAGQYEIVSVRPAVGVEGKMYLVTTGTANVYNLFTWKSVSGVFDWVDLGSTTVDLSQYAKSADVTSALSNKVDKVSGKGLSTNDYTDEDKDKLDNSASKSIIKTSTLLVANWVDDTSTSGYYKYTVTDADILSTSIVQHIPASIADKVKGQDAGMDDYADMSAGQLVIYSESAPTDDININYIIQQ